MKPKAKGSDSQEKEMKSKAEETNKNGWKKKALLWTSVALNIITLLQMRYELL